MKLQGSCEKKKSSFLLLPLGKNLRDPAIISHTENQIKKFCYKILRILNLKECQKYKENPDSPAFKLQRCMHDLKKRKPQGLTGETPTEPNGDTQLKQTFKAFLGSIAVL